MTRQQALSMVAVLAAVLLFAAAAYSHPPRSHAWERLSERFDADGDGRITEDEYDGRFDFARLDKDDDGVLTEEDLEDRGFRRGNRGEPGSRAVRRADVDRDGAVSTPEWQDFLVTLDPDGDGVVTDDELILALFRPRAEHRAFATEIFDRDGNGILEPADFDALFVALDDDGDGVLSASELPDRRRGGPRGRFRGHRGPR